MKTKKLYISKATFKRLAKMFEIEGEIIGNYVIVKAVNGFNTNDKKLLYNNKLGYFFIGDPKKADEKNNSVKTYKVLYSILKVKYTEATEAELKKLADEWLKKYEGLQIKVTDDVEEVYNMEITGSCMSGCGDYYRDLMEAFGDYLKIAYIEKDGVLLGRALLWHDVEVLESSDEDVVKAGDVINVMDRIYSRDDSKIEGLFKEWARKNGYFYKQEQSYNNKIDFISPEGKEVTLDLKNESYKDFDYFNNLPYMDTFSYITEEGDFYNTPDYGYAFEATRTDGEVTHGVYSDYYEEYIPEEDAVYSNILDDYFYADDVIYLDYKDDYVPDSRVKEVKIALNGDIYTVEYFDDDNTITILDADGDELTVSEDAFEYESDLANGFICTYYIYGDIESYDAVAVDLLIDISELNYSDNYVYKDDWKDFFYNEIEDEKDAEKYLKLIYYEDLITDNETEIYLNEWKEANNVED